ncbi:MAG: DUF1501 domain-containing protein [Planctomycetaceae bacterium]
MTSPSLGTAGLASPPCGRTRREFLWETGMGFTGTALTGLLAADGFFGPTRASAGPAASQPMAVRAPHGLPRAKSVIFLFMYGGVSQVDTFDPKPELTKRNGEPIPNLDSDPLFKVRNPGTLLGSSRKFTQRESVDCRSATCSPTSRGASTTWRSFAACTPTASPTAGDCCR